VKQASPNNENALRNYTDNQQLKCSPIDKMSETQVILSFSSI